MGLAGGLGEYRSAASPQVELWSKGRSCEPRPSGVLGELEVEPEGGGREEEEEGAGPGQAAEGGGGCGAVLERRSEEEEEEKRE